MLEISGLQAGYGAVTVLRGLDLVAQPGAVTCLMGRNGAGKTTLLRAIMGLVAAQSGQMRLGGRAFQGLPAHRVPGLGIGYVPQGRRLFGPLSVAENLEIGLMARGHGRGLRDQVLDLFPRLRERLSQPAQTLSGGEQQMLAIGRALCLDPRLLLLDEPTEGLQPSMIALIRDTVVALKARGVAVLLVEQRVEAVLSVADQLAFLSQGTIAETRPAAGLAPDDPVFARYVGL